MINSLKMDCFSSSFNNQQSKNGIIDDEQHGLDNVSDLSDVSSDSDLFEEVNSSASSSPTSSPTSGSSSGLLASGPLLDMSSLLQELPFKRGLSKHYNGKSQSFTSLSNVRCLEDLAKPENPYNKKLKSCRSYAGLLDDSHGSSNQPSRSSSSSRLISRKTSRGSCSSLCVKRNPSFLGTRPPVPPPHRSSSRSSFTTQSPLFALGV